MSCSFSAVGWRNEKRELFVTWITPTLEISQLQTYFLSRPPRFGGRKFIVLSLSDTSSEKVII